MNTVPTEAGPVISARFNFAFSANGQHGVSVRATGEELSLEYWDLACQEAVCQVVRDVSVDRGTQASPLDDGRILLLRRSGGLSSARHEVAVLSPPWESPSVQSLWELSAPFGGYLVPAPSPVEPGFVVARDGREQSTIWRLCGSLPVAMPVVEVPGSLSGGLWLDPENSVLGVNQTCVGESTNGLAIDLLAKSWRRIWSMSAISTDRLVLYSPRAKLFVVSTGFSGRERLGLGRLGEGTVRFPANLHRPGYERQALALDASGERLLIHEAQGAVSRLFIYTPDDDCLRPLHTPPSTVSPSASWTGELIRLRVSSPCDPPTLATVRVGTEPRWSWSPASQPAHQSAWAPAALSELRGPTGSIEAIAYGGSDWLYRPHLVVALHGGPLSSWRFGFDPLFQSLAAAGIAVVAPNYRGSTGYGDEHLRAIIGNWGGPDLDDVLYIGQWLKEHRKCHKLPKPILLGVSYGAFLGLLAAGTDPQLWSACVALAPFLSGPGLHREAGVPVRDRVGRLGGLRPIESVGRCRDVLDICGSLPSRMLLIHGVNDETIPVAQSRTLRQRLLRLGRIEGVDFEYHEVDSDHAGVAVAELSALRQRVVRFCLRSTEPSLQPTMLTANRGPNQSSPAWLVQDTRGRR
jgi:Prolyl oligopeptidase family